MKHLFSLLLLSVLLTACFDSQTDVYDENGLRKGHVTVNGSDTATIVNKAGSIVGEVKGSEIFTRSGSKAGDVKNGREIYDRNGVRKGKVVRDECYNRDDVEVGHLSSDIDDEAAGGACLLLLLL
jgi:hypothetical protein